MQDTKKPTIMTKRPDTTPYSLTMVQNQDITESMTVPLTTTLELTPVPDTTDTEPTTDMVLLLTEATVTITQLMDVMEADTTKTTTLNQLSTKLTMLPQFLIPTDMPPQFLTHTDMPQSPVTIKLRVSA